MTQVVSYLRAWDTGHFRPDVSVIVVVIWDVSYSCHHVQLKTSKMKGRSSAVGDKIGAKTKEKDETKDWWCNSRSNDDVILWRGIWWWVLFEVCYGNSSKFHDSTKFHPNCVFREWWSLNKQINKLLLLLLLCGILTLVKYFKGS